MEESNNILNQLILCVILNIIQVLRMSLSLVYWMNFFNPMMPHVFIQLPDELSTPEMKLLIRKFFFECVIGNEFNNRVPVVLSPQILEMTDVNLRVFLERKIGEFDWSQHVDVNKLGKKPCQPRISCDMMIDDVASKSSCAGGGSASWESALDPAQVNFQEQIVQVVCSCFYGMLVRNEMASLTKMFQTNRSNQRLLTDLEMFLNKHYSKLEYALMRVGLVQTNCEFSTTPSFRLTLEDFITLVWEAFVKFPLHLQFIHAQKELNGPRTIFRLDRDLVMSAGGVLFFNPRTGCLLVQIVYTLTDEMKLSDFGGKVVDDDISIYHTISREWDEETNHMLPYFNLYAYLCERTTRMQEFLVPSSKYCLVVCESPPEFDSLDLTIFGTRETNAPENVNRRLYWVSIEEYIGLEILHPRLQTCQFLNDFLKSLK